MCSGKSVAAKQYVSEHGYTRMPFAEGVREVVVEMVNTCWEAEDMDPVAMDQIEKTMCVGRPLVPWDGPAPVRDHPGMKNYWVERLVRTVEEHGGPVVVDDMRLPNEARALKDAGLVFMYVEADDNL